MKEPLLRLLGQKTYVPANVPELLRLLRLPPQRQQDLQHTLRELEQAGQLARIKGNRYILPSEADLIPGRIRMNRQGKGFLTPDDSSLKEIAVPESATGTAMHEDRVLVRRDVVLRPPRPGEEVQATGTVLRVLERHRTQIVGTLQRSPRFLYVIPDDPRIPHDIYVQEPRDVGRKALIGDKVVVELRAWESRHTNPEGEVVEVLGAPDEEGVDMLSVLRQYNLPLHFPRKVLDEARAIGSEVHVGELAGREDCRRHLVVTIDPDDAKDFDDAICLERVSEEHWKLWVHIADVSHYVKPGTALDDEARRRGNSTYLVDRVIPMLPEALSNELCSLKPNVDRLTKCMEFLVAHDGRVLKTRSYAAVIHSQRRYTYREAFEVLQRPPSNPIEQMLHHANDLAQRIRRLRFKAGALELDFPEMKIRLDEQGRVARIDKVENDISHQLIEEFMLLANEAVAARLLQLNRPAVHRVHEEPDARRLQEYRDEVLSHHVPCGNLSHRPEVQKLLHRLGTLAIGAALKIGFLKSLRRARYAVEPLGHFGLAKKHYAHFTSPIRRYADLVVHRALFESGHGARHSLKETADHISNTERNSADAERDSKDMKLYAFLNAQLKSARPQRYPALVTDLRNFGFFVDVTGLAMSGLVPFSELKDDFYAFDPARLQVVGRRTRRVIKLGDRIEVQVARVDRFKKQVDFRLAQSQPAEPPRHARPAPPVQNRQDRFSKPFDRPIPPKQDRGGSQRRPGPSRPPSSDRTLRSSHSGRPVLSGGNKSDVGRQPARPGQQGQSRHQDSARARRPDSHQRGRNSPPAQPAKSGQPQRHEAKHQAQPSRSGSLPAGRGNRNRDQRGTGPLL
ncbi:MAG: ribonuclease R [Pedosphaera sp.]|nr:ribonuclease R [Pedosphaera sp.]